MSRQAKQREKSRLFICYQNIILVICAITLLFFAVWMIINSFPALFKEEWMVALKDTAYVLLRLSTIVLGLFCLIHLMVLLGRSLFTKHSFVWLVAQQIIPLAFPILVVFLIKLFSGQFDDKLSDVIVGVFSGIISSIIVLFLDRNHRLAHNIIQHAAWEYAENEDVKLESTSDSSFPNNQGDSNKANRGRKRKK